MIDYMTRIDNTWGMIAREIQMKIIRAHPLGKFTAFALANAFFYGVLGGASQQGIRWGDRTRGDGQGFW